MVFVVSVEQVCSVFVVMREGAIVVKDLMIKIARNSPASLRPNSERTTENQKLTSNSQELDVQFKIYV